MDAAPCTGRVDEAGGAVAGAWGRHPGAGLTAAKWLSAQARASEPKRWGRSSSRAPPGRMKSQLVQEAPCTHTSTSAPRTAARLAAPSAPSVASLAVRREAVRGLQQGCTQRCRAGNSRGQRRRPAALVPAPAAPLAAPALHARHAPRRRPQPPSPAGAAVALLHQGCGVEQVAHRPSPPVNQHLQVPLQAWTP